MKIKQTVISKCAILLVVFICSFSNHIKAQGVDVVFWLDNSGSILAGEWTDMTASVQSIASEVLSCNPNNRAAVVHYGSLSPSASDSRIYIESDFTNNLATVQGFTRRYASVGGEDYASESLTLIGNALDGVSSSAIVSPQKTLNQSSTNQLVIFLFTDAARDAILAGSSLIAASGSPYAVYNQFKSVRGATFVVIRAPVGDPTTNAAANPAAAAIASVGGSYAGTVDANSGDPEGSGTTPRRAVISSTFAVSSADISTLASNICSACAPAVASNATTPLTQTVCQNTAAQDLEVTATGTGTLSYQWYSNTTSSTTGGTLITGANSALYSPPTTTIGTKYYYVVVSDSGCEGTATSSVVEVIITTTNCTTCDAGTVAPNVN